MPVVPRLLSWLAILCTLAVGQSAVARSACPNGTLSIGTDATFPPFSSKVGEKFVGLEIGKQKPWGCLRASCHD